MKSTSQCAGCIAVLIGFIVNILRPGISFIHAQPPVVVSKAGFKSELTLVVTLDCKCTSIVAPEIGQQITHTSLYIA